MTHTRKKLIEVALPLEAINIASAREKSIRHGHPSTLHLWWARRPLAAARAVIFAQMVDDPSSHPERFPSEAEQEKERARLFDLIERLVQWENTTNEDVLNAARDEIWKSWRATCADNRDHPRAAELFNPDKLPAFHDPFAGGGALPLEAQRLGLEAYASDLNPVAVLINKAMIEIPPKFAGQPPVNPESRKGLFGQDDQDEQDHKGHRVQSALWRGAQGLAEDVRYYGQWMRDEAEKRIGHLYPKIEITADMARERPDLKPLVGRKLTVIAWLWARTVKSPNPAFATVDVPLASTFMLSTKPGKEAYVEPVIFGQDEQDSQDRRGRADRAPRSPGYRFTVKMGKPKNVEAAKNGTKLARGANFRCLMSDIPISSDHIYTEANAGRVGARLMAIVAEGERGRVYLSPTPDMEAVAATARPTWKPELAMPENPRWFSPPLYGLKTYGDLFTSRQLVALTTFSDLVSEARERVRHDALGARASRPQKTWHSRGYLPHWEAGERPQHITFCLADSLPQVLRDRWAAELAPMPPNEQKLERRKRIEEALDAGHGACALRQPEIAKLVEDALLHFDGTRYRLHAWVVMPTHVHALITPLYDNSLSSILHSWKSFTAKEANRILKQTGEFWQEEYFDRAIRDERHYATAVAYIEQNPVKAGLCGEAREWLWGSAHDGEGKRAGRPRSQDEVPLAEGGTGAQAYADAVGVYLAFAIDRMAMTGNSLVRWNSAGEKAQHCFGRQALPMLWDFAEPNFLGTATGSAEAAVFYSYDPLNWMKPPTLGESRQDDAAKQSISVDKIVSTDPPYYDNIGYADLSDFFYVWLRRSLQPICPDLFATLAVPKADELVATPYRHGSKEKAESFFLDGMTEAMHRLSKQAHVSFPVTIYYAFKQTESETDGGATNTGWETFLDAVNRAGFATTGTWPIRTEMRTRQIAMDTNALASSIVLVCRKRLTDAPIATRREFVSALRRELPAALHHLQAGNIAPVDLAQAAIGPGMAVYTRYARVLDAAGKPVAVREALALINQTLDEVLAEQEGDFDADTRWALAWFEQVAFNEGEFGLAETLSKAKNTSVAGMVQAGIVVSRAGRVRLLRPNELPADWNPAQDPRLTVWEMVHFLVRALDQSETAAADLAARLGGVRAAMARELAYRLYTICERKKRAAEALAYNALVQSWPEITSLAASSAKPRRAQAGLFGQDEQDD